MLTIINSLSPGSPSSRGRGLKYHVKSRLNVRKLSPSSRGRGLKYKPRENFSVPLLSPSSRGRGLKFLSFLSPQYHKKVALFTRAWIEIDARCRASRNCRVALFTRAWIEIPAPLSWAGSWYLSPSSRGRGLKSLSIKFC